MTLMLEPAAGRVGLRPHLRHRRHAHLGRRRAEAAGQGVAQPAPVRPGAQLRDLRDRPDEPVPARHRRRRTSPTATPSPRPAFLDSEGRLRTFDVVLANPPYSIKAWNRAAFAKDPYGRNMWGVPPQGRADYAFFQHIAKSLDPKTGRAAILFPHGVLFRREEADCARRSSSRTWSSASSVSAPGCSTTPRWKRRRHPAVSKPAERQGQGPVHQRGQRGRPGAGSVVPERVPPAEDPERLRASPTRRASRRSRHSTRSPTRATVWRSRSTSPAPRRGSRRRSTSMRRRGGLACAAEHRTPPSAKSSPCCEQEIAHEPQP